MMGQEFRENMALARNFAQSINGTEDDPLIKRIDNAVADKAMTPEEIAKEIVGKWGYEEPYWWQPIAEALEKYASQEVDKALSKPITK